MSEHLSSTRKLRRKGCLWTFAILAVLAAVAYWVLGRSVDAMDGPGLEQFRNAMASAPVVTVIPVEHRVEHTDEGSRFVLQYFEDRSVQLDGAQRDSAMAVVMRSQKLTPTQLATGIARCFYPHYVVSARHADGASDDLIICFDCDNVAMFHRASGSEVDDEDYSIGRMPGRWREPLREFLQSLGFSEHLTGE